MKTNLNCIDIKTDYCYCFRSSEDKHYNKSDSIGNSIADVVCCVFVIRNRGLTETVKTMHTKLYFEDLCYVDSVTWLCRSFEREVTIVCFPVGVREVEVREQEPGDFLLGGDGQSAAHQERWHSGRAGGGQRRWRSVYSQQ